MIRTYNKSEIISETTFPFTQRKLRYQLQYQGKISKKGKQLPDKRFDSSTEGLCIFLYPSGTQVFYAVQRLEMYNKKKNRVETNAVYKKIFRMEDHPQRDYRAAKMELPNILKQMKQPKQKTDQKTFGALAKDFLNSGLNDYRLADKSEKFEYKKSTITKYKKLINTYILLKGSSLIRDRLSSVLEYDDRVSNKPLKDYPIKDIEQWHIECVQTRLKNTKTTANDVVKMISIIYTWAIKKKKIKAINPVQNITKFKENKIKIKLDEVDRKKVIDYCFSKAFDFFPRFLTYVALLLLTGKREEELLHLAWQQPTDKKHFEECSGWLVDNWEREKMIYLRDTKNRKSELVYIDNQSLQILLRLQRSRYTEKNAWAVKSPFLFPQKKNIYKTATYSSFRKHLAALNERLELSTKLMFKICRKTFGSYIAQKKGIEIAARKLNHSSTKVTRDHYIVPEDDELKIDDIYESNVEQLKKAE